MTPEAFEMVSSAIPGAKTIIAHDGNRAAPGWRETVRPALLAVWSLRGNDPPDPSFRRLRGRARRALFQGQVFAHTASPAFRPIARRHDRRRACPQRWW